MSDRDDLACDELVELVTDYLEDALSPADRRRFEAHLPECDGCTAYVEQMRTTVDLLSRLPREDLSPGARASLIGAFRQWRADQPHTT